MQVQVGHDVVGKFDAETKRNQIKHTKTQIYKDIHYDIYV